MEKPSFRIYIHGKNPCTQQQQHHSFPERMVSIHHYTHTHTHTHTHTSLQTWTLTLLNHIFHTLWHLLTTFMHTHICLTIINLLFVFVIIIIITSFSCDIVAIFTTKKIHSRWYNPYLDVIYIFNNINLLICKKCTLIYSLRYGRLFTIQKLVS